MSHSSPDFWNNLVDQLKHIGIPLWAYFISLGGAIVYNMRKLQKGVAFSLKEFIADTVICLSIGFVTYYLCIAYGLSFEMTVVAISLSSGMGNKYYDKVEEVISGVFTQWQNQVNTRK